MESYIANYLATCVTPIAYSFEGLPETGPNLYSLKRKRKSTLTGDGPSIVAQPPTKMARTSNILKNIMGPEAEVIGSESGRPVFVSTPHTRPHGKSPLTKNPFNSACFAFSTSCTLLQPSPTPSPSIPSGTISTPMQKQSIVSEKITTLIPTIFSTTTTTIPLISETTTTFVPTTTEPPTKNTTSEHNPTVEQPCEHPTITTEQSSEPTDPPTLETFPTNPQLNQPDDSSSDIIHYTPSSFNITIPEARNFSEDTPTPLTPPLQPYQIDESVIDTFREHI